MKIKVSKDYNWMQDTLKYDIKRLREYDSITMFPSYSGTWEEEDVTIEQLQEYINKGYSIKINC